MADKINRPDIVLSPKPLQGTGGAGKASPGSPKPPSGGDGQAFERLLAREIQRHSSLRFSAHAAKRLESRNIQLTQAQQEKLSRAVEEAANKGVKESLILLNRLAFIVNIKNRTVITALDQAQMQEKGIFTNIDGAMILNDENA